MILAASGPDGGWWDFVAVDNRASVSGVYTIWRAQKSGDLVAAEIRLAPDDSPLGFPEQLLDPSLLGSPTIWPYPSMDSFMWWHSPSANEASTESPRTPETVSQAPEGPAMDWNTLPDLEQGIRMELLGYDNNDWDRAPRIDSTAILNSQGRWQFDGGEWYSNPQRQDESASHYARRIVSESNFATLWGVRLLKPNGEKLTHQELYGGPHLFDG